MRLSLLVTNILTLVAILLGIACGYAPWPVVQQTADVLSTLFIKFLSLISLPIIFLAIVASLSGMRGFEEMRQLGRRVLQYTVLTTLLAASIALGLFLLVRPSIDISGANLTTVAQPSQGYLAFLMQAMPDNFVRAFADNNVLGVALIAILFGCATLLLPAENKRVLNQFFSSFFMAILKLTGLLLSLMPLGIWAFVTLFVRDLLQHQANAQQLFIYVACVIGANVLQAVIVLPLMLKLKGLSPWKTFRAMSPALLTAFLTKSSNATLPVTLRCTEERLGVSPRVAQMSLPLCSVINMNGCAAFILMTLLFVSTSHGFVWNFPEMLLWLLIATLAAIGNAGVPMGCYFLTSALLLGMGLPLYVMGLILPWYTFMDMIETTLNVWSDACVAATVDRDLRKVQDFVPHTP